MSNRAYLVKDNQVSKEPSFNVSHEMEFMEYLARCLPIKEYEENSIDETEIKVKQVILQNDTALLRIPASILESGLIFLPLTVQKLIEADIQWAKSQHSDVLQYDVG